jgi:cardiolipin-specific phospholipase
VGKVDGKEGHIHTIHHSHKETDESVTPMLLIHGYSQSAAQYYAALPVLANEYKGRVYAIDLFGCGLSSRPAWNKGFGEAVELKVAEDYFVDTLEEWRKAMKLKKMIVVGHSIGGYLSVAYAGNWH